MDTKKKSRQNKKILYTGLVLASLPVLYTIGKKINSKRHYEPINFEVIKNYNIEQLEKIQEKLFTIYHECTMNESKYFNQNGGTIFKKLFMNADEKQVLLYNIKEFDKAIIKCYANKKVQQ